MKILEKLFGLNPEREAKKLQPLIEKIDSYEEAFRKLKDDEIRAKITHYRQKVNSPDLSQKELQKALDEILPEVFALTREASARVLNMRHFKVQLIGGMVLHQGKISEMRTGEGKTLVATLPAVLNALSGRGVHVVTVNEYLARRDSEWMGRLYNFLGLSVGLIVPQQTQTEKYEAYRSDIVYATNNELGFDYLRDNMANSKARQVRRDFNYAIIDEVDSVLIDEARTPLIISGMPESTKQDIYLVMSQLAPRLVKGKDKDDENCDYYLDEKARNVIITDRGVAAAEKALKVDDLWSIESNLAHHLLQALKAKEFFKLDVEYVVQINPETKRKEVMIVDEFTGRIMAGRRWSDGLHQAIEAKEGVAIQEESLTHASITFQNFFRLYPKISGMTGTALTEAEEFKNIYGLQPVPIPTNRVNSRQDLNDMVFKNQEQKFFAIVEEIVDIHKTGRPVLVGTTSIDKSELISQMLTRPQAVCKLLIQRGDRLMKIFKTEQTTPTELIKDFLKLMDKPLNITLEAAQKVLEKAVNGQGAISSKLRASLKQGLNPQEKVSGADGDWVIYVETFLKSTEVLEEIRKGITHHVLNAKHHAKEASIIAQAGRFGAVTIATNMAGRGTDILLGGNTEFLALEKIKPLNLEPATLEHEAAMAEALEKLKPTIKEEHQKVVELGGLHVIGTERHESRRIDNQLRGRAGRQGDPGSTRFYLGLDDQLMRIFGGERMSGWMDSLKADDDIAIEASLLNKGIENAQRKVEAHNFEIRKRVLEYDDVQDTQRKVIYRERQKILEGESLTEAYTKMLAEAVEDTAYTYIDPEKPAETWFERVEREGENAEEAPITLMMNNLFAQIPYLAESTELTPEKLSGCSFTELLGICQEEALKCYQRKRQELGDELMEEAQRQVFLNSIDEHWVEHLQALDALKEGIHLRGYGNKQPLIEYRTEALALFDSMIASIRKQAVSWIFHTHAVLAEKPKLVEVTSG
ncbi:MAG: preprotein translocase subunit SecA [Candidatus Caenarcaniphilales bacterium]|nr:preprotein translocase subunit SecA [Candidatus Caenarcaniphilales bacterium]